MHKWSLSSNVVTHTILHSKCIFKQIYLLIYFWLCWVSVAAHRLSLVSESRSYSLVAMCQLLNVVASLVVEHGLQGSWASAAAARWLSSCGLQAQLPHSKRDSPAPGVKSVSPALAVGLSTTGSPGKSPKCINVI